LPSQGRAPFWSLTRTPDEVSVVCAEADSPKGAVVEGGWSALKVRGPLDFALTGILASIAQPLADAGVAIFAVSTYDTDYVLLRTADLGTAVECLGGAGHEVATAKYV